MTLKQKSVYWSIIVPCYNETNRVNGLTSMLRYLRGLGKSWELIVVDDGSTDDTSKKLKALNKSGEFKIIGYKNNRGKGYAVKTGMLAATGKFRLFIDMDLSTPISEMEKINKFIDQYDVVIGTRKLKGARVLIHQPWLREYLGKAFTALSQIILDTNISDFTCGFKCFSQEASEKIFRKSRVYRWGFDSEILFLAKKYGFSVKEVPVVWKNDERTKVKFPGDVVSSLSELVAIRYFDWIKRVY